MMWIALALLVGPTLAVALSGAGRDDDEMESYEEIAAHNPVLKRIISEQPTRQEVAS
jgi:hypothetical protein